MKYALIILGLFLAYTTAADTVCEVSSNEPDSKWIDFKANCTSRTIEQIKMEFFAATNYLGMGAHFSKDKVNRPGFAKFFFESAGEEREHGIKLMEYLSMRGHLTDLAPFADLPNAHRSFPVKEVTYTDGLKALKDALDLEIQVTQSIRELIKVCEQDKSKDNKEFNHYHFVDYLTGVYLEEQYHGQRDLAGKIATLSKLRQSSATKELGEFFFDKTLL
jgi:ferritin heavy chain